MTDALLTVDDAAAFLRVSRRTVYSLIADGSLRPIKVRSRNRFTRAMLLAVGERPCATVVRRQIEDVIGGWKQ